MYTLLGNKRKDLKDIRFGSLVAKELILYEGEPRSHWRCVCDCGNESIVLATSLCKTKYPTHSCGCQMRKNRFSNIEEGKSAFNQLLKCYRASARGRKQNFSLTIEEFKFLIKSNCIYCGTEPSRVTGFKCNGQIVYNGIDRKDNNIGYTIENSLPCCRECNFLKGSFNSEEFIERCEKIVKHLQMGITQNQ